MGEINEKTKVPLGWAIAGMIFLSSILFSYGILYQKVDGLATDMTAVKTALGQLVSRDKVAEK